MTSGILKSRDRKYELLQKSVESKTVEARQAYTRYRNNYTRTIEAAKANYHGKGFEDVANDIQKTWAKINELRKPNSRIRSSLPNKLKTGDPAKVLSEPEDIANHLNKHFVEKGPKLASKLPSSNTSIYKTLGPRNPNELKFDKINVADVVNIVNNFDDKKYFNGTPTVLIKWCIHVIAPILTNLFNKFVELGVYPDILTRGVVGRYEPLGSDIVAP